MTGASLAEAIFPALARGLPDPPDTTLDPYLDAAERCFARHGISRTAVADIAKDMGVSRTTVYRQVGSIDNVARLIAARELHRFQQTVPAAIEGATGPDGVLRALASVIRFAWRSPVLAKVLRDEPAILGHFFAAEISDLLSQVVDMVAPALEAAMDAGLIRRHDPRVLAEWMARAAGTFVVAPPVADLDEVLDAMLLPVLRP